jgi:hypothetical protein
MAKKAKSSKRERAIRHELRFEPRPSANPAVVYLLIALGALTMGAGAWEQFGATFSDAGVPPLAAARYILFAGALVVGAAIWLGTSGQPALRVGDAGIAVDKGPIRRMAWYAVDRIEWRQETIRVTGTDETGEAMTILAPLSSQPQAGAWIVKEARERIPSHVDVPADATLPEPRGDTGQMISLDSPQVVGKRCAASSQVIAYEPDARLCPRCGRVYHKAAVPETCACGASLAEQRRLENVAR